MTSSFRRDLVALIPDMRAFARSLTRDADAADDLVQDAVTRALRAERRYVPGNLKAWLFTILRNQHTSDMRRRRFQAAPLDEASPGVCATPARQDAQLSLDDFRRAFTTLPVLHREVLILIGASGFSYEEAARICGCPIGTIKSRLSRARRELVAALQGNSLPQRSGGYPRRALSSARAAGNPRRETIGTEAADGLRSTPA